MGKGDSVDMLAGRNLLLDGSQVVGTNDVALTAKGNIAITAAQDSKTEEHMEQEKRSGILGGGFGFTIGTESQKNSLDGVSLTQAISTVGSVKGNVTIQAGEDVKIEAADIISGQNTKITGENVTIEAGIEKIQEKQSYEYKKSGLTVSLSSPAIDTIQTITTEVKRAAEVSDSRLSALYDLKAAEEVAGLGQKIDNTINGQMGTDKNGNIVRNGRDISIDIGFGSTSKNQTSTSEIIQAKGSQITAGGNIDITAAGSGKQDGNVVIKGSTVTGDTVRIQAPQDVILTSAENQATNYTQSNGKSSGIGVQLGAKGVGVYVEGSKTQGIENGITVNYTPSVVTAKDTLKIESGKDTDILGSKANGERVEIRTGNDLNIASQQDIDNYNSKNSSSGGKIGTGGIGAQANVSKGRIDSKYASVTDQAGIYAGQGGFNITVGQNTDLKGAVIASEATPDKNLLSTGTLTYSDIQNKADYSASSVGVNYDSKKYSPTDKENYKNQGLTPNIGVTANGNADSTTKPAIANGTIDIRSNPNQDISGLSRETTNTLNALGKIFDKKTVQEQQELAQVFGEEAFKAIGDLGLKEGSPEKTALDAFTGGLMAKLGGGNFASGAAGAGFNQLIQNELGKIKDPAIHQWASAIVGAAAAKVVGGNAQTGASTAASETKNNYLTHWQEQQRDEAVANGDEDNVAYWNRVDETQETILNQFGISADFIEEYPSAQNILSTITTTVMSLQDEGLDPIAVLSNLSEAGQMFDNAKYGALIAAGIEFGNFSYANKLNHIFGKTEHNLGNFLSRYGGNQAEAFNVLQNAAQDQIISKGITGVFEEPIVVGEDIITVRGNVVDGVVKIGTAFIP